MDRLKLYELGLTLLKSVDPSDGSVVGLCYVLSDAYCRIEYDETFSDLWDDSNETRDTEAYQLISDGVFGRNNQLPEIAAHNTGNWTDGYWKITYDDRIRILEESIEQAKADYSAKEDFDANHWDGDSSQNE
jgi:hypothetical protein